jgi:3-isopropylmalate/(R)-2-methylmalate dehydratase large subunit
MTAQTLTQKIIARAAGLETVKAGDEVWATADRMVMNDSSGPRRIADLIEELGGLWNKERVVLASDHFIPAANVRHAEILKITRGWAHAQEIPNFFEYQGVLHNLILQEWLVQPGMMLVGADSHTVTAGAAGAVAVAVGSTELATVLATGQVWLRVPETVRVQFDGGLSPYVDMRDVTMRLLADLRADFALYKAVEFGGEFVESLDIEERLVLSNQGIEMGSKNAVVVPTPKLLEAIENDNVELLVEPAYPDTDASYESSYRYDVGTFTPLVAAPHAVDNVFPADQVPDGDVDVAWVGSCVGGRYADMAAAAHVLKGQKATIPLLVNPATHDIYHRCLEDGTLQTLLDAGAIIQPAGCGMCAGLHSGILAADENIITTATRNFRGRMGSRDSGVYLASPYTVAASAVAGRIIDPREVISGGKLR